MHLNKTDLLHKSKYRYQELDLIKGIALLGVVIFHGAFDLVYFKQFPLDLSAPVWKIIGTGCASLFICTAGIASIITYAKKSTLGIQVVRAKICKRIAQLSVCAFLISATTYIITPNEYIFFGILHFLIVAAIIGYFIHNSKTLIIIFGLAALVGSCIIKTYEFTSSSSYFLLIGVIPPDFATLDYFPLMPWFAVYACGMLLGIYAYQRATPNHPRIYKYKIIQFLSFLGQHTLLIYMVHQPVLLGIISFF